MISYVLRLEAIPKYFYFPLVMVCSIADPVCYTTIQREGADVQVIVLFNT
jgi:hypothetical protein